MTWWDKLLPNRRTRPSGREMLPEPAKKQSDFTENEQIVDRVMETLKVREAAISEGTFETSGKGIASIICSDDDCPCTDQKQLTLGKDAYLYVSPGVVEFRKDCLTVLELEMKVSRISNDPRRLLAALQNGMPKYVCEVGAKRRGLDLSVALADGLAAAKTGFVPLRATPKALERSSPEEAGLLSALVSDLLSAESQRRDQALLAARQLANRGIRRGLDALEIAIRRKAGVPVEFHVPGLAVIDGGQLLNARNTVLEIAKRGAICREARPVGSLLSSLFLSSRDDVQVMLSAIRSAGGPEQVHQFQLVATHLQAVAGYKRSGAG